VTIDVIADCRLPIADLKSGSSVIRLSPLKWPYPAHLERFPGYGGKELGIFFQSAIGNYVRGVLPSSKTLQFGPAWETR
jgi:hypothetical protein